MSFVIFHNIYYKLSWLLFWWPCKIFLLDYSSFSLLFGRLLNNDNYIQYIVVKYVAVTVFKHMIKSFFLPWKHAAFIKIQIHRSRSTLIRCSKYPQSNCVTWCIPWISNRSSVFMVRIRRPPLQRLRKWSAWQKTV